ncbi:hypothetical protein EYC80_010660 [Monilinia laxa]|uniref:Peptidase S8/S53 domain-containing protein n=1 Tax=Monilinia laxa TaxID=61186 RepID=A0A5N6JMC3_MONLA|nr:hypothetical protein EYC80_010660 [Monilinia laxa]
MFTHNSVVLAFVACASASISSRSSVTTGAGSIVPGAYIARFAAGHESCDNFYQNLSTSGVAAVQRHAFPSNIFPGTSFQIDSDADIEKILSFDQVESISPVRLFSLIAPIGQNAKSVQSRGLQSTGGSKISPRDLTDYNDTLTSHIMTGVDKLHKEGLDGSGLKIAIVDSGIDYTLPALGGGFGPGYKVAFGTDLVGDDYLGTNTPVPDDDPMDCFGHGTHVAGIIAASNDPYVLGVAPNATLGIYKVFGCQDGTVANDVLISAFTMAHNDGADIISASLGFPNGWPEEPFSAAVGAIVAAGTPCILAAGNDGSDGVFYASSASAGKDVTSVGAVENTHLPQVLNRGLYSIDNGSQINFGEALTWGSFGNISLPIWADNYDTSVVDDGCSSFNTNLTDKIALIRRGTCTFDTKVSNAIAAGATYVMFYNNAPGTIPASVSNLECAGAGMVDPETGATWIEALASGKKVVLSFNTNLPLEIVSPGPLSTPTGGFINTYTTWGLANDLAIKPVVSAPGGDILSTYLSAAGSYAVMSGTSMATPFIAGVAGLLIQSRGGKALSPKEINAALSSTATPLNYNDNSATVYSYLTSVAQQGAGLVNAYAVIHANLTLSEYNLPLNDTTNFVKKPTFIVKNTGSEAVTYSLTHDPAMNVYAFTAGETTSIPAFPPPIDTQYSSALITPSSFTLSPNEQQEIALSITPSSKLNAAQVPIYSGFVKITSSAGANETYQIPYAGVATSLRSIPIVIPGSAFFNSAYGFTNVPFQNATVPGYKLGIPITMYATNSWATAYARIDVVGVNVTNTVNLQGLKAVGSVPLFPQKWIPRNAGLAGAFNGTLADGSVIKAGIYKFVVRVEKAGGVFANGEVEEYSSRNFYMG